MRRLKNAWFLLSLGLVLAIGMGLSEPLVGPAEAFPRTALIAGIMFVTALPIDFGAFGKVRGAWSAVGLAIALNAVGAPLLGWAASLLAPAWLATGLIVAAASPCTLASGVVWTRRGGGNDGVAILVTLVTNLGCFIVMPLWIGVTLGRSLDGGMPNLAPKLLACVVAPIVAAQLLRRLPTVARWAARQKPGLSFAAQIGVLGMALLGAINAGHVLRSTDVAIGPVDWLIVLAATAAVHVVLLAAGWFLAKQAGMGRPEAIATAIAGSQKTLAVGVGIALEFGGLAIFPMIAYHVQQLLIDTLFVDRLRAAASGVADADPQA